MVAGIRINHQHIIYLVALAALFFVLRGFSAVAAPTQAAIVMDETTGKVHFARSADAPARPASLTKVMTLYMTFAALEAGDLKMDQKLPVSKIAAGRSPTKLGLAPGSTITVRDAILASIVHSANDAATVLGEAIGGTERNFAKMMTERAHELGMTNTVFKNASGLPHSLQVTTARDMARLGIAIRRDFPQYFPLFATKEFTYNGRTYRSHNRLVGDFKGVDGIKTGYTAASGFNLITSVERDGTRLVAVVMGGKTAAARNDYMRQIVDTTYARLSDSPVQVAEKAPARGLLVSSASAATSAKPPARASSGAWAVQVGAFRSYKAAERLAHSAAGLVQSSKQAVQVAVVPATNNPKPLYRARLLGFDNVQEARQVCSQLKQKNIGCLPVSL